MEYSLRNEHGKSMSLLVFDKKVLSKYSKKLLLVLYPKKGESKRWDYYHSILVAEIGKTSKSWVKKRRDVILPNGVVDDDVFSHKTSASNATSVCFYFILGIFVCSQNENNPWEDVEKVAKIMFRKI